MKYEKRVSYAIFTASHLLEGHYDESTAFHAY